jgi:hypothetical protein
VVHLLFGIFFNKNGIFLENNDNFFLKKNYHFFGLLKFFLIKVDAKFVQSGFYWPSIFRNAYAYCSACEKCQKLGSVGRRNMMPLNPILIVELFDV